MELTKDIGEYRSKDLKSYLTRMGRTPKTVKDKILRGKLLKELEDRHAPGSYGYYETTSKR